MYYEARTHEIVEAVNALDAAIQIKSGQIHTYQIMKWTSRNEKFFMYAVPDGHLDKIFLELAILRKSVSNENAPFQQVESITNDWIKSAEKLSQYFEEAELSDFIMKSNAQLIIGKPTGYEKAWFTCGCCGNDFLDNVKDQLQFDQDAGYGICESYQKW